MVKVRVFLLGILFVSNHRSELLLNADQSRKSVLHRLVLIMDSTSQAHPRRQ